VEYINESQTFPNTTQLYAARTKYEKIIENETHELITTIENSHNIYVYVCVKICGSNMELYCIEVVLIDNNIKAETDFFRSSVPIEIRVMEEAKSVEVTSKRYQFKDCDDDDQREGKVKQQQNAIETKP